MLQVNGNPSGEFPMAKMRGQQFRPKGKGNKLGDRRTEPAASSSNIQDHSYSPETGQLTITYRGGRQYRYEGVSKEIAAGLDKADSKGRYMHAHVIDKHDAVKL
jgi:hypothetical protein